MQSTAPVASTPPATPAFDPVPQIGKELGLPHSGIAAVVRLLSEGSTVPFIARYRKEATGGLDEVAIRAIEERRAYVVELHERRQTVLASIDDQGKLTAELAARILACDNKASLEDLYLPFKPKRRTRATIARDKGLEPLANAILAQAESGDPRELGRTFIDVDKGVADIEQALQGAKDIVAEVVSENAEIRKLLRKHYAEQGVVRSEAVPEKTQEPTKFQDYYDYAEPVANIPSHRYLAVRRGEREGVLKVGLEVDAQEVLPRLWTMVGVRNNSPCAALLREAVADSFERLLAPSVETDVRIDLKLLADRAAVDIFASNLRNLLLAAPLGQRGVVGIDPGIRTGCKCVAVDATGKFLDNVTIYLSQGDGRLEEARQALLALLARHRPAAVAIGNGTYGRETEAFARRVLADVGVKDIAVVAVSESGASVYSASDVAREEFPDLDLTIRGAISIARRLQDPLAELVKIDPKAIGVGQYQHDVHQPLLARKLDEVVESCVNHVGVEINTASVPLLAHVAGIGPTLAKKIVQHRDAHGAFAGRTALKAVAGIGARTFEQAAGFLRVRDGAHPLDASAVHPERYALVEEMAGDLGVELGALVGNAELVKRIDVKKYVRDGVGEPTLRDIVAELQKPGRDPRATFEPPKFRDDVSTMEDLKTGMILEGVVTNVTAFGAFVDVGVHQDGLVHVSQLANHFVKDPAEVVKAGDKLKVRVMEIDLQRKRIGLSARIDGPAAPRQNGADEANTRGGGQDRGGPKGQNKGGRGGEKPRPQQGFSNNPFANLLPRR